MSTQARCPAIKWSSDTPACQWPVSRPRKIRLYRHKVKQLQDLLMATQLEASRPGLLVTTRNTLPSLSLKYTNGQWQWIMNEGNIVTYKNERKYIM